MNDKQIKGIKWAMGTALVSGVAVFANGLVVKGMDPLVHTTVKNGLVGVMILAVLLVTGEWRGLMRLSRQVWLKLMAVALVGGSVSFALFFTGLKMIGGAQGAMIHKTLVLWVMLMAVPLLKERVSGKMLVGVGLLYASNFTAGFDGFGQLQLGHGLVLAATLLWAVENVVAKKVLSEVGANVVVAARMGLGSLILVGMTAVSGKLPLVAELSLNHWGMLVGVAVLLFGYVMSWYRALRLAPATVVAGVLVGASVVTTVLNGVLASSVYGWEQLLQAGMIVGGVGLVLKAGVKGMEVRSQELGTGVELS